MAHIILGLPGENKQTINETYRLLKQLGIFSKKDIGFILSIIRIKN